MTELYTSNKVVNIRKDEEAPRFFPEAKGHEKILASCKKNRTPMSIKMLDGQWVTGEITQFDRWTITLRLDCGSRRTVYKHAMQYFEGNQ